MRARTLTGSLGLSGPSQPIYLARHVRNVPRHHSLQRAIKQQRQAYLCLKETERQRLREKKERTETTQGRDGRTARRHHTGILRRGVWCASQSGCAPSAPGRSPSSLGLAARLPP